MHLPHEIKMILLAMVPVIEQRGAILYGLARNIDPWICFLLAFIGSTILTPLLYSFLIPCLDLLGRVRGIGPGFLRIQNKAIRLSRKLGKFQFLGLVLIVGDPLPGTGVWTGCMVASILKIPLKTAFFAIILGNFLAGIVFVLLSHGTFKLLGR